MHATEPKMQEAIEHSLECARVCSETIDHCVSVGGKHAEPKHIKLLIDCADICATSASFMARGSLFHKQVCAACADICEACAESCEALDGKEMERCAEACHTCAESCRAMTQ